MSGAAMIVLSPSGAILLLLACFCLGTVFGTCVAILRRPWFRPLSPAARDALRRYGRLGGAYQPEPVDPDEAP